MIKAGSIVIFSCVLAFFFVELIYRVVKSNGAVAEFPLRTMLLKGIILAITRDISNITQTARYALDTIFKTKPQKIRHDCRVRLPNIN